MWYITGQDGTVRALQLSTEQIGYDDGGSRRVAFTSGEWLDIPHDCPSEGAAVVTLNWCGSEAVKVK